MRVNKQLNFVVPIYDDESKPKLDAEGKPVVENGKPVMVQAVVAYVHAVPLPEEVVDKFYLVLAQTLSVIYNQGLGIASGPAVAARILRATAERAETWSGPDGVEVSVLGEIRRTANVLTPGPAGWEAVPLAIAAERGALTREDVKEVENAIVFFTVVSGTLPRAQRRDLLEAAADLWSARVSSLSFTEWRTSLRTSTATGDSGKRPPAAASEGSAGANATLDGKPASVPL